MDVLSIAQYVADQIGFNVDVPRCELKEEFQFDATQTSILVVIGFLGILCVVGTVIDVITSFFPRKENSSLPGIIKRILICFSVDKSFQQLGNLSSGEAQFGCFHGIRFFSITWVILGHTYLFLHLQLTRQAKNGITFISSWTFQFVMQALFAVDTFFFISGFLVTYITITYIDKNGGKGFNIPLILFRRISRLLPSTIMMILLTLLTPIISSGPVWHEMTDVLSLNCRKKWWADIIFVNNFIHPSYTCLPHTWYTASDTQLFLVAILYLFIFFRNAKFGVFFNVFLVLCSIVSTCLVNYLNNLPPMLLPSQPHPQDLLQFWYHIHSRPYVHLAVYSLGLATGSYVARNKKTKIRPVQQIFFWCLAIACSLSVILATYQWNRSDAPDNLISALYSGFCRLGWGLAITWMIFSCINGYGGFINSFLSWKGFIPLSRLTFLAYLWHYPVLVIYLGSLKSPIDGYHPFIVWIFIGVAVVTFLMSAVSYVLYDAPFARLLNLMFSVMLPSKNEKVHAQNGENSLPMKDQAADNHIVRL